MIQSLLRHEIDLATALDTWRAFQPDLILVFGPADWLRTLAQPLATHFGHACYLGCTTAGEISAQGVSDGTCVVTALRFESARVQMTSTVLMDMSDSAAAGARLAQQLPAPGLRAVWVLGQGVGINGSAMIAGMTGVLGSGVLIAGGLAGDAAAFKETFVLDGAGVHADRLVGVGLYGQALEVTHGSFGGWAPFGPARKVTRCRGNLLYELDGEAALDVYKRYLGEHAKDLPASGLLFPFAMLGRDRSEVGLIRTILAVDEAQGSLTLAGDIDPDGYLRLMHASTDALVDGAEAAAQAALTKSSGGDPGLALLVSCVGRKLVMGGRVEEEVEAVAEVFHQHAVLAGFYAYGEISPFTGEVTCRLHNQTMTITYVTENTLPA
ncbi:FIST N-terminal domain-containing protein [Rhodoferax sp.]|uniref:FIST signal transduction protein n=1 Tax=Rhodoferax sp. TaxID=50421 RepID=UPI002627ED00|nr:FIST N-terminal domain-containing protein [Rhodoferax sp.]MDD2925336.1 FIST N-terminal domain-containing protein [Rhodoferax sp.]